MAIEVLVLGGGFAGMSAVQELERKASQEVNLTLVSRDNYLLFTPMLPEVASGSIEPRHIVQPLRAALRRTRFVLGEALGLDVHARTVTVQHPVLKSRSEFRFDHVIVALGSQTSTFGLPGINEYTLPLKTLADATKLRSRVIGAFEAAAAANDRVTRDRFLRFLIVGGGFTGVEMAGELTGLVRTLRNFYPALHGFSPQIVVVEDEKELLGQLPDRFGKRAAQSLRKRGVRLELGERVASADAEGLSLVSGKRYESATIVWTTGVRPAAVVETLGLQTSKHGALIVNPDLSVPGVDGVWSLGDCASVPRRSGGSYAALAQNAVREGPHVARNIIARLRKKPTRPFRYTRLGMMASLGDRDAVAELPGKRMIAGVPAWMLWRAYYLSRLPGWPRKIRVAMDWTMSGAFQRGTACVSLIK